MTDWCLQSVHNPMPGSRPKAALAAGGGPSLEFAWTKVQDSVNTSDVQGSALMVRQNFALNQ